MAILAIVGIREQKVQNNVSNLSNKKITDTTDS